jgi:predicted ester cyclase
MADTTRIEKAVEAFNRNDEAYFDLYTDGVTFHGLPGAGGSTDKNGAIDFYRAFWSAFADARVEPLEMIAGDDLIAVRLYIKGTHRGEIMGVAPSGNEIDVEEITIFKLDDEGRCVERWIRLDELSFLQQIGVMHAPATASA